MDILGDSLLTLTHVENQDISIAQHCSLSLCVSLSLALLIFGQRFPAACHFNHSSQKPAASRPSVRHVTLMALPKSHCNSSLQNQWVRFVETTMASHSLPFGQSEAHLALSADRGLDSHRWLFAIRMFWRCL